MRRAPASGGSFWRTGSSSCWRAIRGGVGRWPTSLARWAVPRSTSPRSSNRWRACPSIATSCGYVWRERYAASHPLPLNIMLMPGLASKEELHARGVRRLSAGSAIAQAALGRVGRVTEEFLAGGAEEMFVDAADYGEINRLFQGSR